VDVNKTEWILATPGQSNGKTIKYLKLIVFFWCTRGPSLKGRGLGIWYTVYGIPVGYVAGRFIHLTKMVNGLWNGNKITGNDPGD
jgi:hypothetical protein